MLDILLLSCAAFAAAAISGAAGFGGALLLLPLLVMVVGPAQAVPLLTVAQLVGNISRAGFGYSQIRWRPVGLFLLTAIPCSVLGAMSFIQLPKEIVVRCIGAAILLFVALRHLGLLRLGRGHGVLLVGGGVVGFLSGLVGSAGPLGAAIFLALGLPPVAYVATEATTAVVMHGVKTLVYGQYITLEHEFWWLAACMGLAMILGTWLAKRFIERLPQETFRRAVTLLLLAIAGYLLVYG